MQPLSKTALNYGAISGVSCFAIFLILYFIGFNPLGNSSWLAAWVPILFICLSTRHFREQEGEGFISYGKGFRIGLLTAMGSALVYVLLAYIFGTVIDTGLVERYKSEVGEQLEQTKAIINESLYENAMESLNQTTMFSIAFGDFITKSIGGVLVSLITALIFKKDPPLLRESAEQNA